MFLLSYILGDMKQQLNRPKTLRAGNKGGISKYVVGLLLGVTVVIGPALAVVYNSDYVKSLRT